MESVYRNSRRNRRILSKVRTGPFHVVLLILLAGLLSVGGCKGHNQQANSPSGANNPPANPAAADNTAPSAPAAQPPATAQPTQPAPPPPPAASPPPPAPPPEPVVYRVPAGKEIRVRLNETLDSKTAQPGQPFTGMVVSPVTANGRVIIPAGSTATGTVIDAKSQGRFKGQAVLAVRLETIRVRDRSYRVDTSTISRVEKGKGKRTAGLIGGGAGLGGLIGGLAGGGKGALIGILAGAGAGTAGSAFTGNKQVVIPAETTLSFVLERPLEVQS